MTFLLGKWGKKTKLLFLCTDFGKKKSISIFLKATYAKNICFEKNKTKLSGRESRTTLLCHDGKLFSHDCWLLPLAIIKKYTLKKTPNTKPKAWEYFKEYDLSNSLKQPFQIITDWSPRGNSLLLVRRAGDETVPCSSSIFKLQ